MTDVVAALIWQGDRFLICQRPAHKKRGLLWEFVGGKTEAGETKEAALVRECMEELAVTVEVGDVFMEVDHVYPDLTVHLTLFNAQIAAGEIQLLEHNDARWITVEEIDGFDFCPADEEILERLEVQLNRGGDDLPRLLNDCARGTGTCLERAAARLEKEDALPGEQWLSQLEWEPLLTPSEKDTLKKCLEGLFAPYLEQQLQAVLYARELWARFRRISREAHENNTRLYVSLGWLAGAAVFILIC